MNRIADPQLRGVDCKSTPATLNNIGLYPEELGKYFNNRLLIKVYYAMTTKKILLSLVYTLAIVIACWILFLVLLTQVNLFLYDYKLSFYNDEIDPLFEDRPSIKYVYKSGKRGSIYYANVDTLSNVVVIESTNFHAVFLRNAQTESIEKVGLSQNKTYTTIVNDPFPLIQQVLNPKESNYLKIIFKEPYQLEREIKNNNYNYIRGNFKVVVFGNTQNCSIVTFRGVNDNEILILRLNGKLYFVMQTDTKKSLLELVNPALLRED